MKRPEAVIATFFGTGLCPIAPGTAASLAVALSYKFWLWMLPWPAEIILIAVLFAAGVAASTRYARALHQKDPGRIVIDEVCGQLTALLFVAPSWKAVILSFFLFRFFDIIKPYPIRKLEGFPEGWGIMADDIGAGIFAGVFLRILLAVL
jgi:phosphatidylglycerophosphatase A